MQVLHLVRPLLEEHTMTEQHESLNTEPMVDAKYPVVTGLEHDESGHPASRPANHVMMVAKRRRKLPFPKPTTLELTN